MTSCDDCVCVDLYGMSFLCHRHGGFILVCPPLQTQVWLEQWRWEVKACFLMLCCLIVVVCVEEQGLLLRNKAFCCVMGGCCNRRQMEQISLNHLRPVSGVLVCVRASVLPGVCASAAMCCFFFPRSFCSKLLATKIVTESYSQ